MPTKEQRRKWGLFPSQDVDVTTAFQLLEWSWYRFARSTEALEAIVVRAILGELEGWTSQGPVNPRDVERRKAASIFLRAAVDDTNDETLLATWRAAVNALKVFESQYAWGSKEKASRLRDVLSAPRLVEASRAAAVGSQVVPLELLAVLSLDGSEASADALLPHVERALSDEAQLEPLSRLQRYAAKTKAMASLMTLITDRLEAARTASPVMELAKSLGLASGPRFRVDVRVVGAGNTGFNLSLDSARPGAAFRGWVDTGQRTKHRMLNLEDGATVCALSELPTWLQSAAKDLGTSWKFETASAQHLRGPRLKAFLSWLKGATG
jgi:hypothetical protein